MLVLRKANALMSPRNNKKPGAFMCCTPNSTHPAPEEQRRYDSHDKESQCGCPPGCGLDTDTVALYVQKEGVGETAVMCVPDRLQHKISRDDDITARR